MSPRIQICSRDPWAAKETIRGFLLLYDHLHEIGRRAGLLGMGMLHRLGYRGLLAVVDHAFGDGANIGRHGQPSFCEMAAAGG
jgi:hypothetical protein